MSAANSTYSGSAYEPAMRSKAFAERHQPVRNVGTGERFGSILAGMPLVLFGLKRRSLKGLAMAAVGGELVYRGLTGHCPVFAIVGLNTAVRHNPFVGVKAGRGVKVEQSVTIDRPARELYEFWREFENLPRVMDHLLAVEDRGENRSHWTAKGAFGSTLEWDAQVYNDRPGQLIAWRSLPGGQIDTAGSVRFEELPEGRGSRVRVSLKYSPPGGKVAAKLADWLGQGLAAELAEDLRHFKQVMEAGERTAPENLPSARHPR